MEVQSSGLASSASSSARALWERLLNEVGEDYRSAIIRESLAELDEGESKRFPRNPVRDSTKSMQLLFGWHLTRVIVVVVGAISTSVVRVRKLGRLSFVHEGKGGRMVRRWTFVLKVGGLGKGRVKPCAYSGVVDISRHCARFVG
jgi:hypothetical protein